MHFVELLARRLLLFLCALFFVFACRDTSILEVIDEPDYINVRDASENTIDPNKDSHRHRVKLDIDGCKNLETSVQRVNVPLLKSNRTFEFNLNKSSDWNELQELIVKLNKKYYNSGVKTKIKLISSNKDSIFSIHNTLRVLDGVLLDGSGLNFSLDSNVLFLFDLNSNTAIENMDLLVNDNVKYGIVRVSKNSQNIRIQNNTFVGTTSDEVLKKVRKTNYPGIDISSNVTGLIIDGNVFNAIPTAVTFRQDGLKDLLISNNILKKWSLRGFYFVANKANDSDSIRIVGNKFYRPALSHIKQPIAFQKKKGSSSVIRNVNILGNIVLGSGEPFLSKKENGKSRLEMRSSNHATADAISLHAVDGFNIAENCIQDVGEVGINASRGAKNGSIGNNVIINSDAAAINVGIFKDPMPPKNIKIYGNRILQPAMNLAGDIPARARAGILVSFSDQIEIKENFIKQPNNHFCADGVSVRSVLSGIRLAKVSNVSIDESNIFELPDAVQSIDKSNHFNRESCL